VWLCSAAAALARHGRLVAFVGALPTFSCELAVPSPWALHRILAFPAAFAKAILHGRRGNCCVSWWMEQDYEVAVLNEPLNSGAVKRVMRFDLSGAAWFAMVETVDDEAAGQAAAESAPPEQPGKAKGQKPSAPSRERKPTLAWRRSDDQGDRRQGTALPGTGHACILLMLRPSPAGCSTRGFVLGNKLVDTALLGAHKQNVVNGQVVGLSASLLGGMYYQVPRT